MHLEFAKEMWDKLISSYEGNEKVKDAKLQTYRLQFEQLKMKEDETVGKYFMRVEELLNAMKGLGEKIEEASLVQKILKSLPDRFNPKVSAIEKLNVLKVLLFYQLLGTLTAYEMNIGHFASKCPHKKKDQNSEGEEKYNSKRFGKKKSLCVNNDDSSGDTNSDSSREDKINDFMLMAKEDYDNNITGSDVDDEEVVVDLEGVLINALEEIARLRLKKKKKQKQLLIQFKKYSKKPDEDFSC